MMISPRSHTIASLAYERVASRREMTKSIQNSYGATVHKFPAMILKHGLSQATGFLLAKSEQEHRALLEDLRYVFNKLGLSSNNIEHFHQQIIKADLQKTMTITRQALEISGWMRRYVQGVLKINNTGDNNEEENNNAIDSTQEQTV